MENRISQNTGHSNLEQVVNNQNKKHTAYGQTTAKDSQTTLKTDNLFVEEKQKYLIRHSQVSSASWDDNNI